MSRTVSSLCIAGMASFALLTPSAAHAADTGAQSDANALTATILGQSGDSGTTTATNNGSGENKSGPVNPPISVLTGQPYAGIGVLAQDALATDDGMSAACAGIAGDGGSADVIEIGDTACITPGDNINLPLAELDLSVLLDSELIQGTGTISELLSTLSADQLLVVVEALQGGVDQVTAQLDGTGLSLNVGAVESSCTYDGGPATGTTFLTNVGVSLNLLGTEVPLSTEDDFAPEPEPGTEVVTDLDAVTELILTELRGALNDELDALTDPLYDDLLTTVVQEQILDEVVLQLQPALAAIENNILRITLNEQTGDGKSLTVTGLSAELLPGAEQFGAPTVLDLDIANVGCGPFRGIPAGPGTTDGAGNPVPTVVNAGEEGMPWAQSGLLGLMALLVGGGTVVALRRARS